MGFNPRDYISLQDAQRQSQAPPQTSQPPAPSPYYGSEAYSTTVMPETGEPGPNRSLAGNVNYATPQTAQNYGQRYGARVVTSNMAGGPTKRSVDEYGLDFGRGDVLNAGVIASRDTGNYDKWYDAVNPATGVSNRDKALQDELTQGERYGWGAQNNGQLTQRSPQMFGQGPGYQFSPVAGQDYRPTSGVSPLLKAGYRSGGGQTGSAGSANMLAPNVNRSAPRGQQPSVSPYGGRSAAPARNTSSLYGGHPRPRRETLGAPVQPQGLAQFG